ncbi:Lipoamide acyltransferase component of branched-chain alpha-keto acid dehydrogenase complex [Podosphaera aphanis]|nr:Lipoamide acyltransferase component of branched-chain alpha-keto acid dehydrogenase complex [Podosphaera aphanis]
MNSRLLLGVCYRRCQSCHSNLVNYTYLTKTRHFHSTSRVAVIKPFLLADIGEGITECEITQWFVEPEARVEEWDKLCEVTSDKASVEITSRFSGVIKKLHYASGEMAKVGKPLVDIDIPRDAKAEEVEEKSTPGGEVRTSRGQANTSSSKISNEDVQASLTPVPISPIITSLATLATPAIRHLTKELNVRIEEVSGTGRDGRVLKEDVYHYVKQRDRLVPRSTPNNQVTSHASTTESSVQNETMMPLTNSQQIMFKRMTKSLSIPHFLYADEVDMTSLSELRERLNQVLAKTPHAGVAKLTYLPFIIKAMSMSLQRYPLLNARVDHDETTKKPFLTLRSQHNIGVAMDTPSGLRVPVVRNVSALTVLNIASELGRLHNLAISGKLSCQDLSDGTITVSNIGSIGGTYVSPVIVEKESVILGVGKMRTVPAFSNSGHVIPRKACNFSWSADHRVIDGATMARAAEIVRELVENPDNMILHLH